MDIELILLGGMSPTSVTTAVIPVGGVRSYSGPNTVRFGFDIDCVSSLRPFDNAVKTY